MITEKSQELGRLVGQSDEYQALKRANERLMEEPQLRSALERLRVLQLQVAERMERGHEPTATEQQEIDTLVSHVQGHSGYQAVVAAQSNFDKLMMRINEWILEGIRKSADSRIITLG
jgi:cell fate (sporulation/competence/biofilm development) regulator YlbF (YheA/YmcA/DUF963 family)